MQSTVGKYLRVLLFMFLICSFDAAALVAQSTYGSLTGQVTDPQGAAIANARVTLTNLGTNNAQTVTTDSTTGIYVFKLVSPGKLRIACCRFRFCRLSAKRHCDERQSVRHAEHRDEDRDRHG